MNAQRWSPDSLKDYVDSRIQALAEQVRTERADHVEQCRIEHTDHAALHAHDAEDLERRLAGMNKFREQLETQAGTFLTREAYERRHEELEKMIDSLQRWRATVAGRTIVIVALVGVAMGLVGTLIGHLLGS